MDKPYFTVTLTVTSDLAGTALAADCLEDSTAATNLLELLEQVKLRYERSNPHTQVSISASMP